MHGVNNSAEDDAVEGVGVSAAPVGEVAVKEWVDEDEVEDEVEGLEVEEGVRR